jgi:ABC-type sugar transport system ATPase subunit
MTIAFRKVSKVFADGTLALDGLDLEFEAGEFVVLLGPSGSGKTTACRLLAGLEQASAGRIEVGLEQASAGRIEVDGQDITDLPPRERKMSMVFQNYALYAHKSVHDNIAYPLKVRRWPRAEIESKVKEVAGLLDIERLLKRRPRQLSGGEAQRVAVARALVWQPDICLMDEPLSNLDAILRLQTRTELKRLHGELGTTFVFVTHDQEEAMTLGTRIAVLKDGRVAEFIGRPAMNTIDGGIADGIFRAGDVALPTPGRDPGPVVLGIRPEHIVLHDSPRADTLDFRLDVPEIVEPDMLLFAACGEVALVVRAKADRPELRRGDALHLEFPADRLCFFDPDTGARRP